LTDGSFPAFRADIVILDLQVNRLEIAAGGDGLVAAIDDLDARLQMSGETLRRPILARTDTRYLRERKSASAVRNSVRPG